MSLIHGITAGGSGHFTASVLPGGALLQTGSIPKWTADDPAVTFVTAADGSSTDASVPASDLQGTAPSGQPGSFNMTVTGKNAAGATISSTFNVPIYAPVPPPPPQASGFNVSETSWT